MDYLEKLAEEIRLINITDGQDVFFEKDINSKYSAPAFICLIHSEISEASTKLENPGLDPFLRGLVNIATRILDFVSRYKETEFGKLVDAAEIPDYDQSHVLFDEMLLDLHYRCTNILKAHGKGGRYAVLVAAAKLYAAAETVACIIIKFRNSSDSLYDLIRDKVEQDKKRRCRAGAIYSDPVKFCTVQDGPPPGHLYSGA